MEVTFDLESLRANSINHKDIVKIQCSFGEYKSDNKAKFLDLFVGI